MSDTSKTDYLTVLTIWVAGLCAAAQFAKISVAYVALGNTYPEAGTSLGLAVSLISFVGLLCGAVAGVLVSGLGFRRVLIAGLLVGAAMSFLQALLPGFTLFLISRVIEGASHLAIVVAAPTLLAKVAVPKDHPKVMTLWSCFFGVAYALTGWFGAPVVAQHGPAPLFVFHGATCLIMAGVLAVSLPKGQVSRQPMPRLRALLASHRPIYGSVFTSSAAFGWLFYTMTFVAILTLLPQMVGEDLSRPLLTSMPLISIAASMTLGVFLLERLPADRVLVLGFATTIVASGCLFLWPQEMWPYLLLSVFWGVIQGAGFAMVPQLNHTTEERARANGAFAQMGNFGNLIGTPILAAVLSVGGTSAAFVYLGLIFVVGIALQTYLRRLRLAG